MNTVTKNKTRVSKVSKDQTVDVNVNVNVNSFEFLGESNGVVFGDAFLKLPAGDFAVEFTNNVQYQENKYYQPAEGDKPAKGSPKTMLVESIIVTGTGTRQTSETGMLRIGSSLKKCQRGKSYNIETRPETFEIDGETKNFNKVISIIEIAK